MTEFGFNEGADGLDFRVRVEAVLEAIRGLRSRPIQLDADEEPGRALLSIEAGSLVMAAILMLLDRAGVEKIEDSDLNIIGLRTGAVLTKTVRAYLAARHPGAYNDSEGSEGSEEVSGNDE